MIPDRYARMRSIWIDVDRGDHAIVAAVNELTNAEALGNGVPIDALKHSAAMPRSSGY